ncbi:MAG TPA: phosphomannomutase, partial [Pseudomonadales bacterium]|nr:phosphomannomutase [Pseudomonadales bacterium]
MSAIQINCFKAYDVRGRVPDQINEDIAYRIGRAFVQFLGAKSVVVGHDIRLSSQALSDALVRGLREQGADVIDIGLCGTEEVYFATFHLGVDGGIAVTASHNPMDYNGMKFVREGSRPISGDTGLKDIQALAESGNFAAPLRAGNYQAQSTRDAYVQHLLGYVDRAQLKPLKLVINAGNGGAGLVMDALEKHLPFQFVKVHHQPDGTFPNGVPNPLLEENRGSTIDALKASGANMGIAWDGDFDRCFFFDEKGNFIEGYYVVGLLAEAFLARNKGAAIVHDPRLTWNTLAICEQFGGRAVQSKTGHAFIKERMRKEDAVYGGEMSAHHYFRDFAYCDSGMIPWLLVAGLVCSSGKPLSQLVEERMRAYPVSGEINREIADPKAAIARARDRYIAEALHEDNTDGLSLEFADWRFNLRMSNTEPVVRLNVE